MFKIISSEEHAKLTKDVDYWKTLALKEEKRKKLYQRVHRAKTIRRFN